VKNLLKRDEGFTLIEIVLVLAIAGLILLMVFLAVSGAQRSRRDTQRKEDLSRIASQLESFASNNNGTYPQVAADVTNFNNDYMTPASSWKDPLSGNAYTLTLAKFVSPTNPSTITPGTVYYEPAYTCGSSGWMQAGGPANSYAVVMILEQGAACRSNQ